MPTKCPLRVKHGNAPVGGLYSRGVDSNCIVRHLKRAGNQPPYWPFSDLEANPMQDTRNRVPANTDAEINRKIRDETDARVRYYQQHKDGTRSRLRQLDDEWDIERAIECNASALAFTGVVLGARGNKRWLLLPAMVTAFLFQHAIQGWCPPVPTLRRMGFRTASEIEQERQALKALRGDFAGISNDNADAILSAVRA
jgi:hypothetical protein